MSKMVSVDADDLAILQRIVLAANELEEFLGRVGTDDPDSSPICLATQGPDAELYAAALCERLSNLHQALDEGKARAQAQARALVQAEQRVRAQKTVATVYDSEPVAGVLPN